MAEPKKEIGVAPSMLGDLFAFGENALNAPIKHGDTEHFAALGRFVVEYASAEAALHMLARKLSGLEEEKGRVIFGGMRLSDLVERVRKMLVLDAVDVKIQEDVDECLVQLDLIAGRRHKIVHRTVRYEESVDALSVSNLFTAKSVMATEREIFKKSDLSDMEWDCRSIFLRLADSFGAYPDAPADEKDGWRVPWRYKPLSPTPPKKPRQKARIERKRRRRASGA